MFMDLLVPGPEKKSFVFAFYHCKSHFGGHVSGRLVLQESKK